MFLGSTDLGYLVYDLENKKLRHVDDVRLQENVFPWREERQRNINNQNILRNREYEKRKEREREKKKGEKKR